MPLTTKIDTGRVDKVLTAKARAIKDPRPVWRQAKILMIARTGKTFRALGGGGGRFRSTTWKPFAPQYIRMDGTEVPARGGVPKVRGTGVVKGRLRPSGKRITASSKLMQDTGALKRDAGTVSTITVREMQLSTGLDYAQEQQDQREFLYFETPQDLDAIRKLFERHIGRA